jgi:hypothetical protein
MKIIVNISSQTLIFMNDFQQQSWPVSTAANGPGERSGSFCTPRGAHRVRLKIGRGCPFGTVFKARRPTGEIYTPELGAQEPHRDWILSRILWLSGQESGKNKGGFGDTCCDTLRRYIYIHGTPDESFEQAPRSHGCIRMRNADIIELFDLVETGCIVEIFA